MVYSTPLVLACQWLSRIAWLNLCWLLFTFAGLVIAGILPSTVAALVMFRRYSRGVQKITLNDFRKEWQSELVRSNLCGWSLLLSFLSVIWCLNWMPDHLSPLLQTLSLMLLPVSVALLIWLVATLVQASHLTCGVYDSLRNGLILLAQHPSIPLAGLWVLVMCSFLCWLKPVLALFFLAGPAMLTMVCMYQQCCPANAREAT